MTMTPSNELPVKGPKMEVATNPVTHDYGDWSGKGFEGATQDDYAMPYLNLLQNGNPEVGAEGPEMALEGAKPGMMLNSVTKELIDGRKGLVFVPVARQHAFVEWRPRKEGGGLVERHKPTSDVVRKAKAESTEFGKYSTDEGNDLVETFYLIGYTLENPEDEDAKEVIVIAFNSTKIKPYKHYLQMADTCKGKPPLFANRVRVTSFLDKNKKGPFFNFKLEPINQGLIASLIPPRLGEDGQPTHPLLVYGKHLNEQVHLGERRMADESVNRPGDDTPQGKEVF